MMRSSQSVNRFPAPNGTVLVHTTGSGPDLVFVHGWPTNATTWRGVVAHLSRHFTCHVIDLPGSGQAALKGVPRLGFADQSAAVVAALEGLDLKRVVLVGHDSGGALCRFVAADHPDRVTGLVLTGTEIPFLRPAAIRRLKLLASLPGCNAIFRTILRTGWARRSGLLGFGVCFSDSDLVDGAFLDDTVKPLIESDERCTVALEFLRQFDFEAMDQLEVAHRKINAPCLLLWGERDPVFPLSDAREMLAQFAGPVSLEVIDDGHLFPHEEFPQVYARRVRDWFHEAVGPGVSRRQQSA